MSKIKWSTFKGRDRMVHKYLKYYSSDFDVYIPMNVSYQGKQFTINFWHIKEDGTVLGLIDHPTKDYYIIVERTEVQAL